MRRVLRDLAAFTFRGNVIDLAVGIVIGTAFTGLVNAFVKYLLTPLIAIPVGQVDFSQLVVTVGKTQFHYGDVINALVTLVLDAAAIFFFVVKPVAAVLARRHTDDEATTRDCPECLSEIPLAARRCAHCTAEVATAA